ALQYKTNGPPTNPTNSSSPCKDDPGHGGLKAPGGFGWLSPFHDCLVETDVHGWAEGNTGGPGVYQGVSPLSCFAPGDVVMIPIYDCINATNVGDAPCPWNIPNSQVQFRIHHYAA